MNFHLNETQTQEVLKLYNEKTSIKELAKMFNCCCTTMSNFLKERGITPSRCGYESSRKFSKEKDEEIVKLYKAGMNQKKIAEKFQKQDNTLL